MNLRNLKGDPYIQRSIMKTTKLNYRILLFAWLVCIASQTVAGPIGTAFTYQGKLATGTDCGHRPL